MLHSRAAVRAKNRTFLCSFGTRQSLAMSYGQLRAVATEAEQYPHGITSLSDSSKMANTVQQLGHVSIEEFQQSNFVKPQSVFYELDGAKRRWDVIKAHDSIAIVLYHRDKHSFLLVRQFRPALYASLLRTAGCTNTADTDAKPPPLSQAFTYELCAGLVDKEKSLEEIAHEEVMEECGYDVPVAAVHKMTSYTASVGVQGTCQTLFYAEVDESMRMGSAGGVATDGERIELLALPVDRTEAFLMDESVPKTPGALFGLLWAKNKLVQKA